ncbi:MAG: pentapeptide repeat-containing protein [Rhodospirillaceae bacterium]|nr:pentapeptide repeat-containing protein [Rhodospirillaceae bacterium]
MNDDTTDRMDAEDLKRILRAHLQWLRTDGKEGERANLKNASLQEASLQETDLQGADLQEANLQGANLQGANLEEANLERAMLPLADLQEANLQGSNLGNANFIKADLKKAWLIKAKLDAALLQGASLKWANLRGASLVGADLESLEKKDVFTLLRYADLHDTNLTDAKLSNVKGLQSSQLGGADLTNAKLPPDIAEFKGLNHVTEISKHARNVFLAVVGGCVYSWLTIATTTDAALLTNSASTPLPIIQTKVPIAGFFLVAPAILLTLYIYLHMYLQRMWEGLASLPAIFPDGRRLDERAYPWLLTSLVHAHVPRLKTNRPVFWWIEMALSILSAWCLVPGTIAWFWLRHLPLHDWLETIILIILFVCAAILGVSFYLAARSTLNGEKQSDINIRALKNQPSLIIPVILIFLIMALPIVISDGAINGTPTNFVVPKSDMLHRKLVQAGFSLFGFYPALEIEQAEISKRPENWDKSASESEMKIQLSKVKQINLKFRNLKYMRASGAFFANANLFGSDLRGAILANTGFQGANLVSTNLTGSDLSRANFQYADIGNAVFIGSWNLTNEQILSACTGTSTFPLLPPYQDFDMTGFRACR